MIEFENTSTYNYIHAIMGMRNPLNSWDRFDTKELGGEIVIGPNDLKLAKNLAKAGPEHRKFMRMMCVTVDINAPLYWWKEMDTYKIGTVCNSCSTMHTLHKRDLTLDDFSHDQLLTPCITTLQATIDKINVLRKDYISEDCKNSKEVWYSMIQLLPSSFNQRRTLFINYETLHNIATQRYGHRLKEWKEFLEWERTLPYADELIFMEDN